MENKQTEDFLRDSWESLGIAFATNATRNRHADPERTLLKTLSEFTEDRKILKLVLAWLKTYGTLIHVERIKALTKDLSAVELAWLGGLAEKQILDGDWRWRSVSRLARQRLGKTPPLFKTEELDRLQIERVGSDAQFKEYGLLIPTAIPAESKKLRPYGVGIKRNLWLRMRILFGCNWRADMATLIVLKLAQNPYQAERLLGCAKETAYRNWKSLKEAELEQILKFA